MRIRLTSSKGGQGRSVTAVRLAHALHSMTGKSTRLIGESDVWEITATQRTAKVCTLPSTNLCISSNADHPCPVHPTGHDLTVIDGGEGTPTDLTLLVTTPCYLSLSRAVREGIRADGVILLTDPERALGIVDVQRIFNVPVFPTRWGQQIARAVDAGMLFEATDRIGTFHNIGRSVLELIEAQVTL